MPLIELNPTEEACTAFAAYHCKADESQSNVDFTKSVLLGIMQNSVLEQRKKEALIAVDEEQTPDVEEVSENQSADPPAEDPAGEPA